MHHLIAAWKVGAVAQEAEDRKYKYLDLCHFFTPVAIETGGVLHIIRTNDIICCPNQAIQLPCSEDSEGEEFLSFMFVTFIFDYSLNHEIIIIYIFVYYGFL